MKQSGNTSQEPGDVHLSWQVTPLLGIYTKNIIDMYILKEICHGVMCNNEYMKYRMPVGLRVLPALASLLKSLYIL